MSEYMIARVGEDSEPLTLGVLRDRVAAAIMDGVPLDTPLMEGYSPQFLSSCLSVKKPIDVTMLSFERLQSMAIGKDQFERNRAWIEIERRVLAGGA